MRVVVAGGTGLIGRALVAALVDAGDDVTVLSRRRPPPGSAARTVVWDGRTATEDVARAVEGATAVVNLAGAPVGPWPWTAGRRREILRSRLEPTTALVAAIARIDAGARPSVLVSASGTDGYTDAPGGVATESTPFRPSFLASVCEAWESAAVGATAAGVEVAVMRTGLVVGPGATALRLLALPARIGIGPIAGGSQWVSWIHLDDTVRLLRAAMCDPRLRGPVNVVGPSPVRQKEVARALGRVLGRPTPIPLPGWPVRLLLREQATLLLGSRRVVPRKAVEAGFEFRHTDLEAALREALDRP